MTSTDLRPQARIRTRVLLRQARDTYGLQEAGCEVRFDLRGTAAGQARHLGPQGFVIRYNPILLRENAGAFIARTVPHEVAHVIVWQAFGAGVRPHGEEWRRVMAFFGADASRCHGFDLSTVPRRRQRRFRYRCGCEQHLLSSIRHNRVLRGERVYLCVRCGEPLVAVTD